MAGFDPFQTFTAAADRPFKSSKADGRLRIVGALVLRTFQGSRQESTMTDSPMKSSTTRLCHDQRRDRPLACDWLVLPALGGPEIHSSRRRKFAPNKANRRSRGTTPEMRVRLIFARAI